MCKSWGACGDEERILSHFVGMEGIDGLFKTFGLAPV
jgi:hypothetical protein